MPTRRYRKEGATRMLEVLSTVLAFLGMMHVFPRSQLFEIAVLTRDVFSRQQNWELRGLGRSVAVQELVLGVEAVESQVSDCLCHGALTHEVVGNNAGVSGDEPMGIIGAMYVGVDAEG